MATLSDVRTDVRSHLDETTATFWTEAELNRWINEAARDIARRAEVLQDRDDVSVLASTREYSVPSDVIRIHRVEFKPTGSSTVYPLEYRDFNSMDAVWWTGQEINKGTPSWYTLWGFPPSLKIVLYPTPSSAGTLKIFNYRLPTDATTDGATVEIPEGWQDAVVLYCEYVALRKDGDPRWQEAKALYEERLGQLIDVTRRWTDQADSVQFHNLPQWLVMD